MKAKEEKQQDMCSGADQHAPEPNERITELAVNEMLKTAKEQFKVINNSAEAAEKEGFTSSTSQCSARSYPIGSG